MMIPGKGFSGGEGERWPLSVGWILGYHSALTQPLQLGRGGEPTPLTCAYIYHSVDLLYSAIESSF
jgi:hypothetical protein